MGPEEELVARATEHAQRHGLVLARELGHGVHGIVFLGRSQRGNEAPAQSAIKVHRHETDYRRERDVYLRLKRKSVSAIRGCHVPKLLRYDDDLLIIEMTIVTPPYLLDFAGAFLDKAPDFSEEVMADWLAEKQEQFEGRWPEVAAILGVLQGFGIHYIDVSPKNIALLEKP